MQHALRPRSVHFRSRHHPCRGGDVHHHAGDRGCTSRRRRSHHTGESIASLDHPSGGRLILGVGFGWNTDEPTDHGVPGRDGDPEIVVLDFTPDADTLECRREVGVTEVVYGMPDKSEADVVGYLERLAGKLSAHTL